VALALVSGVEVAQSVTHALPLQALPPRFGYPEGQLLVLQELVYVRLA
jgi:hypothetical protein